MLAITRGYQWFPSQPDHRSGSFEGTSPHEIDSFGPIATLNVWWKRHPLREIHDFWKPNTSLIWEKKTPYLSSPCSILRSLSASSTSIKIIKIIRVTTSSCGLRTPFFGSSFGGRGCRWAADRRNAWGSNGVPIPATWQSNSSQVPSSVTGKWSCHSH